MLCCSGSLQSDMLKRCLVVGELALDGASAASTVYQHGHGRRRKRLCSVIVHWKTPVGRVVQNIEVYGVASFARSAASGELPLETTVDIDELFNVAAPTMWTSPTSRARKRSSAHHCAAGA